MRFHQDFFHRGQYVLPHFRDTHARYGHIVHEPLPTRILHIE